jgi:hypothetical protein
MKLACHKVLGHGEYLQVRYQIRLDVHVGPVGRDNACQQKPVRYLLVLCPVDKRLL